jgi:hypothetical protein
MVRLFSVPSNPTNPALEFKLLPLPEWESKRLYFNLSLLLS